ncbi:MAG: saccharopine dehydrogenase family protein [Clostridiales bacterium]|nr:saccharopine dehydrogenase family protein [Clostridiales bacterium]
MKVVVLGAGLVGKAVALDLAADGKFHVSAVDLKKETLDDLRNKGLTSVEQRDLSRPDEVKRAVKSFDLVINAVPGFLGFGTLKACLEAGKNVIDIAFSPEDPFELDGLCKRKGITAVVDCGVAPGLSNILAGHALTRMDKGESLVIYVGGLPVVRKWPFEYKTVFSPSDVIEEYLRPARFKENGEMIIRPALSDPELVEFEGVGTLEAFNSDGLRTLLKTLPIPNMKEKTLRYPGHREKMAILKEAGLFDTQPLNINGKEITPRDITAEVLFSRLKLQPGEEDLTIMRVVITGKKSDHPLTLTYDLCDRFDQKAGFHSMARTTGFTAAMAARAFGLGMIKNLGITPPEFLGFDPECYHFILSGLEERGVRVKENMDSR